jgi:hypothetical protein
MQPAANSSIIALALKLEMINQGQASLLNEELRQQPTASVMEMLLSKGFITSNQQERLSISVRSSETTVAQGDSSAVAASTGILPSETGEFPESQMCE